MRQLMHKMIPMSKKTQVYSSIVFNSHFPPSFSHHLVPLNTFVTIEITGVWFAIVWVAAAWTQRVLVVLRAACDTSSRFYTFITPIFARIARGFQQVIFMNTRSACGYVCNQVEQLDTHLAHIPNCFHNNLSRISSLWRLWTKHSLTCRVCILTCRIAGRIFSVTLCE